jgi:formate dehydrogenase subunit beta
LLSPFDVVTIQQKDRKMSDYVKLEVKEGDVLGALRGFFASLIEDKVVDGVLTPVRLPYKQVVMQTLVRDPARLAGADPLAPVVPTNAARLVAQLTHDPIERSLAAVLRSCEIRAFVELVKLRQARRDDLLLIGLDCRGRYETGDFLQLDGGDPGFTLRFYKDVHEGKGTARNGKDLAAACKACEFPVPEGVDIRICTIGTDLEKGVILQGASEKGRETLSQIGVKKTAEPQGMAKAVEALVRERTTERDRWLDEMRQQTRNIGGLMTVLGNCINCYNCRVACPACYCRECVFVTDTFQHNSDQYLRWAEKKGMLKMPTDTLFYHLTRMQHMSTLCVGCGQCTSACPSDIPVAQLFRSVAAETQKLFEYQPGRDIEQGMPLAAFHEKEFEAVTAGS